MIVCLGDATAHIHVDPALPAGSGPPGIRMLGDPGPADGPFFTVRIEPLTSTGPPVLLGLRGIRPSSEPTLLGRSWADAVWIGAGPAVHAVDLRSGRVTEHRFESPFMEFFVSRKLNVLTAVHESGMRCFGADGAELWRAATDLVEDLVWTEETVTLRQMDAPPLTVSLVNGRSVP